MDQQKSSPSAQADADFVLTRVFDAPRDLVFKVWTQQEHLSKWFSPKGFSVVYAKMDLRPGGTYHYGLSAPEGHTIWGKWVFREIVVPERIALINSFSDEQGGLTRHPMAPDWPLEMLSTTTFTEKAGKTTLTLRWAPYNATEIERGTFDAGRAGMKQGWGGTMEQLTGYLASLQKNAHS